MSKIGIVAYTAEELNGKVIIHRACAGQEYIVELMNWDDLVDFLTEDLGIAIHICWSLYHFSDIIFSLLPRKQQREIEDNARTFVGDTKIFSVDRLLGITTTRQIDGSNICERKENNFYSISHWLPEDTNIPNALELEKFGYDILGALEKLGLHPDKLTSPIGAFMGQIDSEVLPTIFNTPESLIDAMNYADNMARYEWRKIYSRKKGYHYDLTSAYPYFISNLPDTRHGTMSRRRKDCEWGIMKGNLHLLDGIMPVDKNSEYFTTEEIDWVERHNAGDFEFEDGWFFNFNGGRPYQAIINKLLEARQTDNTMVSTLAKKISQGISGKLDQYNEDGSMGELYNPILAAMVRSRCRIAVADFIYDNNLRDSLIEVKVDGVTAIKKLELPSVSEAGKWRLVV